MPLASAQLRLAMFGSHYSLNPRWRNNSALPSKFMTSCGRFYRGVSRNSLLVAKKGIWGEQSKQIFLRNAPFSPELVFILGKYCRVAALRFGVGLQGTCESRVYYLKRVLARGFSKKPAASENELFFCASSANSTHFLSCTLSSAHLGKIKMMTLWLVLYAAISRESLQHNYSA